MSAQSSLLSDYLSPAKLADELGVCTKALDRWRVFGDGPPITKIGRRTFYSREGVAAWLQKREQKNQSRKSA
jgi:Helix-turn-helix domain